jgi:hypothetical protein
VTTDAAALDAIPWHGTGVLEVFDVDQVAWAIRRRAARGCTGDGSLADRIRGWRHRQITTAQLLAGVAPPMWVPRAELVRVGLRPVDVRDAGANVLTTAGAQRLLELLTNQNARQALDATHTRVGFGDGATAALDTDVDLSAAAGATHRWFQVVDGAGVIAIASGAKTLKFTVTVAAANGNLAGETNEWCVDGGTANGNVVTAPMINRAVQDLGKKSNVQTWAFTGTLSVG